MALHGVSRATADIDLFTLDEKSLQSELWGGLEKKGAALRLLKGDFEDPWLVALDFRCRVTEPLTSSWGAMFGKRTSLSPQSRCRSMSSPSRSRARPA